MPKGKSMKFDMDLDNEGAPTPTNDVDVPEVALSTSAKAVPAGEDIILPIRCTDENGNIVYYQKSLEAMTGDEFLSWVYDVTHLDEQTISNVIRLRGGEKLEKGVEKLKIRMEIFKLVVHMHEERWLFLKGRERHPDYAKWN